MYWKSAKAIKEFINLWQKASRGNSMPLKNWFIANNPVKKISGKPYTVPQLVNEARAYGITQRKKLKLKSLGWNSDKHGRPTTKIKKKK